MPDDALRLARPSPELLDDYLSMIDAARACGEDGDGFALTITEIVRRHPAAYLVRLDQTERGENLPADWVPTRTRWLRDAAGRVVGETRIRWQLTPALEIEGGHIGYFVHPHHRRRGYGTAILNLALAELRGLNVARVLVTCNADNVGSRRVIERSGGVLDRHTVSPKSGKSVMRFWIETTATKRGPNVKAACETR